METEECCICSNPMLFFALACSECFLRRKILLHDSKCPLCTCALDSVVLTNNLQKSFEDFQLTCVIELEYFLIGDRRYNKLKVTSKGERQNFKVHVDGTTAMTHFTRTERLWQLNCPSCTVEEFASLTELKQHLEQQHKLYFCDVCIHCRLAFVQEQKLYTSKQLQRHLSHGDKDTHIKHSHCKFCNLYLYDTDKLFFHLQEQHYNCFICDSSGQNEYYNAYIDLETHFSNHHHLCPHKSCLEQKFVAFKTVDQLYLHSLEVHGNNVDTKKKWQHLPIQFHVRGSAVIPDIPTAVVNPSDVARLVAIFPHVTHDHLRRVLRQTQGDVDAAVETLLQDGNRVDRSSSSHSLYLPLKSTKAVRLHLVTEERRPSMSNSIQRELVTPYWSLLCTGLYCTQVFPHLSLLELVKVSMVCKAYYREASDPLLWKKFGKYFPRVSNCVHMFKDWRHLILSLVSRKRRCARCGKQYTEFMRPKCKVLKRNTNEVQQHTPSGPYIISHSLVLYCSKPSDSFKKLREHLQRHHIPTTVDVHLKGMDKGIMLRDPNTDCSLYSFDSIRRYIDLMYMCGRQDMQVLGW